MHVQAGVSVGEARAAAHAAGLLLPLDAGLPDAATVGGAVACNEQGPRRARFGSVRDIVLGVGVVLPGGDYVRCGGQTMKNVAGLNLTRLFVGSLGTLGVVADAWVRLLPAPQQESFVAVPVSGTAQAGALMRAVVDARLAPDLAELLPAACLDGACPPPSTPPPAHPRLLLLGFAGDGGSVARQVGDALRLAGDADAGPAAVLEPAGGGQALVDRVASFRHAARAAGYDVLARAQVPAYEAAAYASALETAAAGGGLDLVTAAGLCSGVVQLAVKGDAAAVSALLLRARAHAERLDGALVVCAGWEALPDGFDGWGRRDAQVALLRRLKAAVDPHGLLNRGRLVGGL
jgi:glycolate oxidase FAD binding subunit